MSSYVRKKSPGNTEWFVHDRFGMFIHFGLFALPARHEWVKFNEEISEEKYDLYFKYFNPDLLDMKEWIRSAKRSGMKYAVITAKHHDGFCLFDSKYTDYKITNTAYGKDLIKEFTDVCREEGIKIGLYYSLLDWHHPSFPIDKNHPRRNEENVLELDADRDMKVYNEYMRNQVTELLTNYGKIDILWFDFFYYPTEKYKHLQFSGGKQKEQWEAEKLIKTARDIQPDVIINNRSELEQDLFTPEQYLPGEWIRHEDTLEYVTWEGCHTFSGSWGYYRDENTWKSPEMLINILVDCVSCGGNLIMNVGPTARGVFDHRAISALKVYEEWMKYNSRSIYGCTMAEPEFKAPDGCKLTQSEDGKRLYIHLQTYPFGTLVFRNLDPQKIEYAQFLSDGSEVLFEKLFRRYETVNRGVEPLIEKSVNTAFFLPTVPPHGICPVIELILK